MTKWQVLASGFAFYLIFEGLVPFFNPAGFKRILSAVLDCSDSQLRTFGGFMLALGVIILFMVK